MPSEPQRPEESAPPSAFAGGPVIFDRPRHRWHQKIFATMVVIFCMAIGLFLLIFPWTSYWETDYFASLIPQWHAYWDNMYIRGAVSGLGVVNLYISILEIYRLRRFARR